MTAQHETGSDPQWTLGDRLRKARESAGMSSSDMAATLDVSRNTIGNYESGRTHPATLAIRAWALATGVREEWLRARPDANHGLHPTLTLVPAHRGPSGPDAMAVGHRIRAGRHLTAVHAA